jgi:hypothetical protein
MDVSFQQGHPHFTEGLPDVGFGELSLAPEMFEYLLKLVGQIVEHDLHTTVE